MGGYGLLWESIQADLGNIEPAEIQPDGGVRIPVTLFETLPVGQMRVISVVDNERIWGSTEPFEIISQIGDGGDWDVGGRALFLSHPRGGERWQRGRQYVISWLAHGVGFPDSEVPSTQFRIQFLRGGRGLDTLDPRRGPLHGCEPAAWAGPRKFYPDETVTINWRGTGFQSTQTLNAWATITANNCAWPAGMGHWIATGLPAQGGEFEWEIGTVHRIDGSIGANNWVYTPDCLPIDVSIRLELESYRDQIFAEAAEGFSVYPRRR